MRNIFDKIDIMKDLEILGSHIYLANFDKLVENKDRMFAFVWPDEGQFVNKKWIFNEEHKNKFEPLLIDIQSTNAMLIVYNALDKQENKDKFKRMISKNRGTFGTIIEFCWSKVSYKTI